MPRAAHCAIGKRWWHCRVLLAIAVAVVALSWCWSGISKPAQGTVPIQRSGGVLVAVAATLAAVDASPRFGAHRCASPGLLLRNGIRRQRFTRATH